MGLQLFKFQDKNEEARLIKSAAFLEDWEDDKGLIQYESFLYVPEIICYKLSPQ